MQEKIIKAIDTMPDDKFMKFAMWYLGSDWLADEIIARLDGDDEDELEKTFDFINKL